MSSTKMIRVIAYIDGFNLYFGLKSKAWNRYFWLDIKKLCMKLLKSDQHLIQTKYFTSLIPEPSQKKKRQDTYLAALETLEDFEIIKGRYQLDNFTCPMCRDTFKIPHEKKTDVNIATEFIFDSFDNAFDIAMIISADSDLVPPIMKVKEYFPEKRLLIVFPPNRSSFELSNIGVPVIKTIRKSIIKNSQLPEEIDTKSGYKLARPKEWT